MEVTSDFADGSTTITLLSGLQVRIPRFNNAPNVIAQDIQNVSVGLLALIADLDKRLAVLEGRTVAGGAGR